MPARLLLKADPAIAAAVAATAEPLAVALHAVNRLAPRHGETVVVTGCGMIGALAALVLSRRKLGPVLVADRNRQRAELVSGVTGAGITGLDAAGLSGVAGVVEATGSTAVLSALIDTLPAGGRIALVGIFDDAIDLAPTLLVERELALVGCHAFRDELPEAASQLKDLADAIAAFVGEPIGHEEVPAAYQRIISGKAENPKTVILP